MVYRSTKQNKMATQSIKTTFNGVEVESYFRSDAHSKKKFIEVYTPNRRTKMFMEESIRTGKPLRISIHIDGLPSMLLSTTYDYGMALHIFTDLVNKFSNK